MSFKSLFIGVALLAWTAAFSIAQDPHAAPQTQQHDHEHAQHDPDHAHDGAQDAHEPEEFNAGETMLHHVLDTHDWEILQLPVTDAEGHKHYKFIGFRLPWLFHEPGAGLKFFANRESMLRAGYVVLHDKPYRLKADASREEAAALSAGHGHGNDAALEALADKEAHLLDLSPTKTVVQMMLVCVLLLLTMTSVARAYTRRSGQAPTGLQSFMEPIILYIRDEVARPNLKNKADRYMPYLLTLFFFIWFSNMLGLTPFNFNITGNISITFTLALFTFILVQVNGSKDYWGHIVAMPGVPKVMWILTTPLEIFGMFTKPIALMIRLFANISGGHFMVLALVCLIFILGKGGQSLGGAIGIMPLSIAFGIFIFALEIIVALIQAYVFTLLTAVFMGQAMESHSHEHAHEHEPSHGEAH